MAQKNKVTVQHSAEIAALYQKTGVSGRKLLEMYPQYSKATVYRHTRKPLNGKCHDARKQNKGRPPKLTGKDMRHVLRTIPKLREREGSFTSRRVAVEAGVEEKVSNCTVRRFLNKEGYAYLRSRKKGLMTRKDLSATMKFCRNIRKRKFGPDFWRKHISFYLDGKGFEFKTNPFDQARAPKAREWRKQNEGLKIGCTSKGRKEGAVTCNFMVGISYDAGVVLCEQYYGPINGDKMAGIVHSSFQQAFEKSINPKGRRFLQDGCPRQNSRTARDAFDAVNGMVFKIPPRSPDLNPIENFFNCVMRRLSQQALDGNITKESKEDFSARVKKTMLDYEISGINKIIDSMDKRIGLVLKANGMRIKY
eukprot:gene1028-biopygen266